MRKSLPRTHFQLQLALPARFASFARQRSYGYASSQELTNRTWQNNLQLSESEYATSSFTNINDMNSRVGGC